MFHSRLSLLRFSSTILILALLLVMVGSPLTTRIASATSYHTIVIDGTNDFATDEDFLTSSASYTAYFTWDTNNLYLGYTGTDVGTGESVTKWIVWYLDTDPQLTPASGNGTTNAIGFISQDWTLPFNADYMLQIRTDGGFNQLNHWNGSTWSAVTFNGSIFDNNSSNFIEVRLPKSDVDTPNCTYVLGNFINEQGGNEWTYASWPGSSLVDGYYTNGYFNHWWGYSLNSGISPDAGSNYDQQLGPPNFNIFFPIVAKNLALEKIQQGQSRF